MSRGAKTRQPLTARAHLGKINAFVPQQVKYSEQFGSLAATFSPATYRQISHDFVDHLEGVIRSFPIIFHSDGTPWDLGNLYLQKCFQSLANGRSVEIATLQNKAKALALYLRWVETLQEKGDSIHVLGFSGDKYTRPTYRYHRYLQNQLRQIPQPIALSTSKERMSQVIQFYRGCLEWNLVGEDAFENAPFEERTVSIHYVNAVGLGAIKQAVTTDISFRGGHHKTQTEVDGSISDGGRLVPLNLIEQPVVLEALAKYGNRTFELICQTALLTGARLQTVCTLRICDLRRLEQMKPDKYGEKWCWVGQGCLTDIKGEKAYNKRQRLYIPEALITVILAYVDSELAIQRREKGFYGDTDKNYVFLNQDSRPFYTSRKEMSDRASSQYSERISLKDRVDFPIANGQAIENLMRRLREQIAAVHPEFRHFRFHDFRATFGMNFMRDWIDEGKNPNQGIGRLRARMGHSSESVTFQYLNWVREVDPETGVDTVSRFEDSHHDTLDGGSK